MEGVSGLASGIDTAAIIDAMVEVDRQQVNLLNGKREVFEGRREAVRTLNLRLLDADLEALSLRRTSTFGSRSATPADEDVFSARANTAVGLGTYDVTVNEVAKAQQIATQTTVADKEATDYSGDITFTVGGEETTIEISEDSTLEDVAAAINSSSAGVGATIVNAGTEETPSFRLILQTNQTGTDNVISEVVGSSGGNLDTLFGGAGLAGFDELQAATNTSVSVTIGSGPNAITTTGTSSSTEVSDLIAGLTINAKEVGTSTLTVGIDNSTAKDSINSFIESINSALEYHSDNATYDDVTNEAGILFSENDVRNGINGIKRALLSVSDEGTTIKTLGGIGINFNSIRAYLKLMMPNSIIF